MDDPFTPNNPDDESKAQQYAHDFIPTLKSVTVKLLEESLGKADLHS